MLNQYTSFRISHAREETHVVLMTIGSNRHLRGWEFSKDQRDLVAIALLSVLQH